MRTVPLLAMLCVLACGDDPGSAPGPDAAAPDGGDTVELAPYPGWPAQAAVRRVGSAFRTRASQLELEPRGGMWLLREEWRDSAPLLGTPVLERYGASGRLERRVALEADTRVPGFVVHPSGQLSVFVLQPAGALDSYRLEIVRLSPEGEVLARHEFQDTPGPREDLYYDDSGVRPLHFEGPPRFGSRSHVVGMADGEGLYLLAWSYGVKLYRLEAGGTAMWEVQIMPANLGMAYNFIPERLAVDESGRIHVAYQIFADDVHIYNEHYGRSPLTGVGSYDVLVERFDADGTFSVAQVLGGPGVDAPSGMTARGGEVLVTGASRIIKHEQPNRTMEWDLFVLRADLGDPTRRSYRTFDLSRDDFGWAMAEAPDGTIYIAGRTDYVQVDTNSEVEDGKGLLLALSPDLERSASLTFAGPRDVQVQVLRLAPDGRLLFAGLRDGPLTHTDPSRQNNEGVLGAATLVVPAP